MNPTSKIWLSLAVFALALLLGLLLFEIREVPEAKWKENYLFSSKEPNGTFVFRELLTARFPSTEVKECLTGIDLDSITTTHNLYILLGNNIQLNNDQTESILAFVEQGNKALLIANRITLGADYYNYYPSQYMFLDSSLVINYYDAPQDTFTFKYYYGSLSSATYRSFQAFGIDSQASVIHPETDLEINDTSVENSVQEDIKQINAVDSEANFESHNSVDTLPTNTDDEDGVEENGSTWIAAGHANRSHSIYQIWSQEDGEMHFYCLPLLFSNQAALQPDYRQHFNLIFKNFKPHQIWLDHMSWHAGDEAESESPLQYILSEKSLRTAYYLLIAGILLYLIFNSKRRQRIIPPVEINPNTTMEYVQTVSSLYLSQDNHVPVINYLREGFYHEIRRRYFLDRFQSNLAEQLAKKSQVDLLLVKDLLEELEKSKKYPSVRPTYPVVIYQKINNFFKKAK